MALSLMPVDRQIPTSDKITIFAVYIAVIDKGNTKNTATA